MMAKFETIALAAASLALVASLTACGGGQTGENPSTTTTTSTMPEAGTATTTAPEAGTTTSTSTSTTTTTSP